MSSSDFHEVLMKWPHADANEVYVTGTFDQWSSSVRLERTPSGFEAPVFVPFGGKIQYKFIVDGVWVTDDNAPTVVDHGFINNVYTAPAKPESQSGSSPSGNGSMISAMNAFAAETLSANDAPTPTNVEPSKPLHKEITDVAAPVIDAATQFADQLTTPFDAPTPTTVEPTKTIFDYAKDVAASFFPGTTPKSSPSPAPSPPPIVDPTPVSDSTPKMPMTIVPVNVVNEDASTVESAPEPDTTTMASGEESLNFAASTHIPLPELVAASTHIPLPSRESLKISRTASEEAELTESTSQNVESTTPTVAPPVMAAEPVSESADIPKVVVEAAPVAVVETAAAPTSAIEVTNGDISSEEKVTAPEVLAAPPPEAENKEVAPVEANEAVAVEEPKETAPVEASEVSAVKELKDAAPLDASEVTAVEEPKETAPVEASEATADEEPKKAAPVEEPKVAPVEPEVVTTAPAQEPSPQPQSKAESKPDAPKETAPIPSTPKKGEAASSAPTTPQLNGHKKEASRNGSIRGTISRFASRRISSQHLNAAEISDSPTKDKSSTASVGGSIRKKRLSLIDRVKDVFHKDDKKHDHATVEPSQSK